MSGKPAARQGDMTQYGGPIVQGSAGVRIGAPTGVACSVCPGGMTSGNPVNPLLGAKVLPGETDLALPGPLPFILSRTYSSYRTRTPAPVGVFGPGWKAPSDTGGMTTATWCASAARDRRGNTATVPRAGWRACAPSHRTWTSASRMPRTRRATGCRTRSCTRTVHSQCGRITASRRMRTMSTATMNTAG